MSTYIKIFFKQYYFIILCLLGLGYLSLHNYILFHSIVEISGIVLGCFIIIVFINSKNAKLGQGSIVVLGISYGFITLFGILHTMLFEGIGLLPMLESSNLSIQLYMVRQYLESISLLLFVCHYTKKINTTLLFSIYMATSFFFLLLIFHWDIFPDCFIEGYGLTTFKKISEITITMIMIIVSLLLFKKRKKFHQDTFKYLSYSIMYTIFSTIFFIFFMHISDIFVIIGHMFKVVSTYWMYKAIVRVSLITPVNKLRSNEQKYYNLIQLLPEAVFVHTCGKITLTNLSGLKILDVESLEELQGKSLWDFIDFESTSFNKNKLYTENQYYKNQEFIIVQQGGKRVEVKMTTTAYNDESTMIIIHDISEQKKAERLKKELELEEQKLKNALEYEELKYNFYINVTHEFKTPLNVLLGIFQLLEKDEISEQLENHVYTGKQNCYRLWRLMDNLIDISRINANSFNISMSNNDIVQVVEDITLSVADYIKDSTITVTFDTDVEEKVITCDPYLIERILLNLFSNGIKFSKEKGNIFVNMIDGAEYVTIEVEDDGIGIPEDNIPTVFESFTKVDDSLTRNSEGCGMGLSIVFSLVEMHGGSISVYSKNGYGSRFVIKIPATVAHLEEETVYEMPLHRERIDIEFSDIYTLACNTRTALR